MLAFLKKNVKNICLYLILAVAVFVLFTVKVDYHVDELLTYSLSNSTHWIAPEDGVKYTPANQAYLDVFVSDGHFDPANVWEQQKSDTHPPFFYLIFHVISTIFSNSISMRYGAALNLVFLMLTLFVFRKLLRKLIDDETSIYLMSVFFCLCASLLSLASFIRMYIMVIFLVTLFAYLIQRGIERFKLTDFIILTVVTIIGALTHYYFIVFAFFSSAIICIYMLVNKRIKDVILYVVSMGVAGGASLLIFPTMIDHIFKTGRGAQSLDNLGNSDMLEQFKIYFDLLNKNTFGGLLLFIICAVVAVCIVDLFRDDNNEEKVLVFKKGELIRYLCLLGPALMYLILISKTAPYNTDRYLSPIFPVTIAGVLCLLYKLVGTVLAKNKNRICVFAIALAFMTALSFANCQWEYLKRDNKDRIAAAKTYGEGTEVICLYRSAWKLNPCFVEISNCYSSTFYRLTDYNKFTQTVDMNEYGDKVALYLIECDDSFVENFKKDHPDYKLVKDNGTYAYCHSYYFERAH